MTARRADHPLALLGDAAGRRYDHEPITQLDHALQAAFLAEQSGAPEPLILAALFHDVGHLRIADAGAASRAGRDRRHEAVGALWLARGFRPAITEPVRLHVAAKRHLARDPAYRDALSDESRHTLTLQGGPFDDAADRAFLDLPYAADAVRLRRWDDAAKDPDAVVPDLEAWRALTDQHWAPT